MRTSALKVASNDLEALTALVPTSSAMGDRAAAVVLTSQQVIPDRVLFVVITRRLPWGHVDEAADALVNGCMDTRCQYAPAPGTATLAAAYTAPVVTDVKLPVNDNPSQGASTTPAVTVAANAYNPGDGCVQVDVTSLPLTTIALVSRMATLLTSVLTRATDNTSPALGPRPVATVMFHTASGDTVRHSDNRPTCAREPAGQAWQADADVASGVGLSGAEAGHGVGAPDMSPAGQ